MAAEIIINIPPNLSDDDVLDFMEAEIEQLGMLLERCEPTKVSMIGAQADGDPLTVTFKYPPGAFSRPDDTTDKG